MSCQPSAVSFQPAGVANVRGIPSVDGRYLLSADGYTNEPSAVSFQPAGVANVRGIPGVDGRYPLSADG
jgi:hypothetical protein